MKYEDRRCGTYHAFNPKRNGGHYRAKLPNGFKRRLILKDLLQHLLIVLMAADRSK
jgi:hypothetical protein